MPNDPSWEDKISRADGIIQLLASIGGDVTRSYQIGTVLVHAVIDDSGKFKDKPVISWTALIAGPKQWIAFSEAWLNLLRKHDIPYLHVKDLRRWDGVYSTKKQEWGDSGQEAVLEDFADLVRGVMSPGMGIGLNVTLDVQTWRSLTSEQQRNIGRPDLAAFELLMATILVMNQSQFQSRYDIGLVCDDEEEIAYHVYKFWRKSRIRNPALAHKAVSLTFCNDEAYAPIQFADLLSNTCFREALREIQHPDVPGGNPLYARMTTGVAFGRGRLNSQFMAELSEKPPGQTALDITFEVKGQP